MTTPLRDRTIALAGVFQAAAATQQLAREGNADESDLSTLVRSLVVIDAIDTAAVYGGTRGLKHGLELILNRQSTQADITNFEIARYVFSLTQLASRLGSEPQIAQQIGARLKGVDANADVFDSAVAAQADQYAHHSDGDVVKNQRFAALADIYSDTISKLTPQIVVHGERGHLGDPQVVDRVRTALFAGVRSAWMWQQVGGRKWHLVLSKKAYANMAEQLLSSLDDLSSPDSHGSDGHGSDVEFDPSDARENDNESQEGQLDNRQDNEDDDSHTDSDRPHRDNVTNINRRR